MRAPICSRCEFAHHELDVGLGINEIPLTMMPVPVDVPLLFDALLGSGVGELMGRLLELGRSELAWAGERVSVVGGGAPAPVLLLTSWPSVSPTVSTNNTVGPATTVWVWRSCRLFSSGWLSGVIQIATGPLIPWGTMQLPIGCEVLVGWPPMSIWQLKFCGRTARKCEIESGGAMREWYSQWCQCCC